jgi:hypothetical protein
VPRGGLYQVSPRRHGCLQGARRGQALPAPGLPQGSSDRRHAALYRAWRRQAVPRGGLYQVSPRRHGCLQGARRRQAVPARRLPQVRSRRLALLQGAWRGQALPARGLPQGSCWRWHTALRLAWGRQALPAGGLHQGSRSSSRQCVLHAMSPARAARRCVGRCIATAWRGPGAPSHGWDRAPTAAGGECGATHRLATVHTTESPPSRRRST